MNKKVLLLMSIVVFAIAGYSFINQQSKSQTELATKNLINTPPAISTSEEVNSTAGFAIFTNNTFRIFTDPKYHEQSETVFITADNPNIVHVKKEATWDDFFKTLPMELTHECLTTGTGQEFCSQGDNKLRFYINGRENKDALGQIIKSGDQLLVSYGNESDAQIQVQLQSILDAK